MSTKPAVFLDRDGTLIHDPGYLADPAGVRLLPGAADAVRRLNEAGWLAVVVTNQSGIARGLLTEDQYHAVARAVADATTAAAPIAARALPRAISTARARGQAVTIAAIADAMPIAIEATTGAMPIAVVTTTIIFVTASGGTELGFGSTVQATTMTTTPMAAIATGYASRPTPRAAPIGGRDITPASATTSQHRLI